MSQKEIVNEVKISLDPKYALTLSAVKAVVSAYLDVVLGELVVDRGVVLPGIGVLKVVEKPPRTFRNPKTGQAVEKPHRLVVKFRASRELKDALEEQLG